MKIFHKFIAKVMSRQKQNLLAIVKTEHNGSQAVEFILLSPLVISTFFLLLYFFFMSLTYIAYNNIANSIAQELNMRQTGYQQAINDFQFAPQVFTYKNHSESEYKDGGMPNAGYLNPSAIQISPETQALKSGSYFAIDKYRKQFIIPFSEITGIEIVSSKPINPSDGVHMSGALITVKIYYNSMVFGNDTVGVVSMKAIGYGIIS